MSANLDFVRAIYAAWARGDFASADWADPTIEFEIADGPDPTKAVGLAETARTWGAVLSVWEDFRVGAEEYRELDGDRVVVVVHNSGRAKGSGLELGELMGTSDGANLLEVRDGKVVRFVLYFDRERAFAELGLAE